MGTPLLTINEVYLIEGRLAEEHIIEKGPKVANQSPAWK